MQVCNAMRTNKKTQCISYCLGEFCPSGEFSTCSPSFTVPLSGSLQLQAQSVWDGGWGVRGGLTEVIVHTWWQLKSEALLLRVHPVWLPGAWGTWGSVIAEEVSAESKECDHSLSKSQAPNLDPHSDSYFCKNDRVSHWRWRTVWSGVSFQPWSLRTDQMKLFTQQCYHNTS